MTFFSVSAAVQSRSVRCAQIGTGVEQIDEGWIVGVSGVSATLRGGASSNGTGGGTGTRTASVLAA